MVNQQQNISQPASKVLYLEKDINPAQWLKTLPDQLHVQELTMDRISLHEIFIDIATNKNLLNEAGEYNE